MAYTKQTWADGPSGATPVSAARLAYIENGIEQAHVLATNGNPSGAIVQADSFPGTTDAAKMSAALTYASQQTHVPWVQTPARIFDTGTASFDWFFGMKICGPGFAGAPKNMELGNKSPLGIWRTTCGTGANSLLRASATVQSVAVSNVQFYGPSNTSQIFRASGGNGLYPSVFTNLGLYGGPYFFGNPSEKFLTTQMVYEGHWTVLGYNNTPFTIGGGDAYFNWYLNSNSSGAGGGKPIVDLQGVGKTNIQFMYLTAEGDWVGLRNDGGGLDKSTVIFGGVFEGRSQSNLATRPVIRHVSGNLVMKGPFIGQVSSSGSALGAVEQQGGNLVLEDPLYYRGAATTAAFPLLYQTGGTAQVIRPVSAYGEQVRVRWSTGVTDLSALPANVLA